jgi:glycine cleavage system H protein
MTTQDRQPSLDSDHEDRVGVAVSPALGPLPAIYVQQPMAGGGVIHHMSHLRHQIGREMSVAPDNLRFNSDHMWARLVNEASLIRVGITDFAQESLGDVVDVTLPKVGETITAGQACGDIESVKSVSDLIAPISGTIRTRNEDLVSTPELVNSDPYGRGWMFEAEADSGSLDLQLAGLMDARAYRGLTGA